MENIINLISLLKEVDIITVVAAAIFVIAFGAIYSYATTKATVLAENKKEDKEKQNNNSNHQALESKIIINNYYIGNGEVRVTTKELEEIQKYINSLNNNN